MSLTVPSSATPHARRIAAALTSALGVALAVAACGGSTPPAATTSASQSPQNGAAAAYKYADCMRSHGVPNFPDPKVHTTGNSEIGRAHV